MRLMPLMVFLSVTILVVATGCKSTANQNGASQTGNQNTMSQNAESSQTANNSTATTSDKTKTEEKASNNPRYRIDAGQSRLTARVFVGGLLSAFGHDHDISIRDVAGEVQL